MAERVTSHPGSLHNEGPCELETHYGPTFNLLFIPTRRHVLYQPSGNEQLVQSCILSLDTHLIIDQWSTDYYTDPLKYFSVVAVNRLFIVLQFIDVVCVIILVEPHSTEKHLFIHLSVHRTVGLGFLNVGSKNWNHIGT